MADYRSELDDWLEMWSQASKEGTVKDEPKVEHPGLSSDGDTETTQDLYFDYLDSELLQEEEQHIANPIYPDSVGPDAFNTPPVWANEDVLKEIQTLKDKLFDVENKLAAKMGGDKKWQEKAYISEDGKLMAEIESLRKQVEKISSVIGIENEHTPWVVKRD